MGVIRLANNQELNIIADGICASGDNLILQLVPGDKTITEYDEIFSQETVTKKITVIDYLGDPFLIRSGYTKLMSVEKQYDVVVNYTEDEDGNKVPVIGTAIRISLVRPDKTEQRLTSLEETVDTLVTESLGM